MIRSVFLALGLLFLSLSPALAVEPQERLTDPVLEARARTLGAELRCMVCLNTSIDESTASLAHDLRVILRERIAAGDTDAQALAYMTQRYGEFILLKPRVEPETYLLWFTPPALLVFAALMVIWRIRHRRIRPEPAPLTAEERRHAAELLGGET
jgi:cytochrome c-type biogenesis protein CcmH